MLLDKYKVMQILVNLISNAKYALAGSATEPRRLTVGAHLNGDHLLRISVADNGIGIVVGESRPYLRARLHHAQRRARLRFAQRRAGRPRNGRRAPGRERGPGQRRYLHSRTARPTKEAAGMSATKTR